MRDTWTIFWKEWKEMLLQGGTSSLLRPLLFLGIGGILFPLEMGPGWTALGGLTMFIVPWLAFLVVISNVSDTFAGERERHTLETLLASRMPDRAILLGKVAAIVAYGWGILLMNLLVGAVAVNVVHRQGHLAVYPPGLLAAVVFIGLFFCIFGAAAGVLISLRAKTVRQAQQILTLSSVALPTGIAFLLQKVLVGLFQSFSPEQVVLFIVAAFVLADIVLLALALARFQRSRLILS
jgi:ABC-2 type transport system permease protein